MKKIITLVISLVLILSFTVVMPVQTAKAGLTGLPLLNSKLFNGSLSSGTFTYERNIERARFAKKTNSSKS